MTLVTIINVADYEGRIHVHTTRPLDFISDSPSSHKRLFLSLSRSHASPLATGLKNLLAPEVAASRLIVQYREVRALCKGVSLGLL
jgi:hypothetical protein